MRRPVHNRNPNPYPARVRARERGGGREGGDGGIEGGRRCSGVTGQKQASKQQKVTQAEEN